MIPMALPLTRVLLIATALCLSHVPAHAQGAELVEVHLLAHPDAPAQSATFEIVNESDHEISSLAVSCRFRNLPPGSVTSDAAFPAHVRGVDVTCHIVHQISGESR
jgi:hypothetical protein